KAAGTQAGRSGTALQHIKDYREREHRPGRAAKPRPARQRCDCAIATGLANIQTEVAVEIPLRQQVDALRTCGAALAAIKILETVGAIHVGAVAEAASADAPQRIDQSTVPTEVQQLAASGDIKIARCCL